MAESNIDWDGLRLLSLRPDGFREERPIIWPRLLHITVPPAPEAEPDSSVSDTEETKSASESHRDERQIQLDTDRSFVHYPVEDETNDQDKISLQKELNTLIVRLFRRRPKLNYFQGFHDIATVLLVTLPKEIQLLCTEQMSLQRLRDSMGTSLDPVVGQLYVLKKLLRAIDPEYAELIEQSSPIPYFALSNLLTLFSHDLPTIELVQHVFDYLLCRPPIAAVYLAAAIVLTRKSEAERLQRKGGYGMLHSLLSRFPDIEDGVEPLPQNPHTPVDKDEPLPDSDHVQEPIPVTKQPILDRSEELPLDEADVQKGAVSDDHKSPDNSTDSQDAATLSTTLATELNDIPVYEPILEEKTSVTEKPALKSSSAVSLCDLLRHADKLFQQFPPTTPNLCVDQIFGPNSVLFTWSEDPTKLPLSDDAEAMVDKPQLVSLGYFEPPPELSDDEESYVEQPVRKRPARRYPKPQIRLERSFVIATIVLVVSIVLASGAPRLAWRNFGRWFARTLLPFSQHLID